MEDFKKLLTQYSDYINNYNGTDRDGLLNIGEMTLNEAKKNLSTSEYATLSKSINDFYNLQLRLKDIDIQSIHFKSHLIGFAIYVEMTTVFII